MHEYCDVHLRVENLIFIFTGLDMNIGLIILSGQLLIKRLGYDS
jgi:hypothetical protein